MKKIFFLAPVFIIVLLSSCTKNIDFTLPKVEQKIVVEGWIEQNQTATVIVTRSSPYFDPIDSASLIHSIVTDAVVKVSDGTNTETLILTVSPTMYPFIMYQGSTLKGVVGKTYTLTVEADGKTYTAHTSIPEVVYLDSVWFAPDPSHGDSLGFVNATGFDNGATTDYYRIFTKRLHKDQGFVPISGSVWDDKFFNGQKFNFTLYRGSASNLTQDSIGRGGSHFSVGDTVISRLCHIDVESYLFWRSAEREIMGGANPFSSTTTIPTNIDNGGLGIWWGFGASYDTVICRK
ncbi:MAG: DUF4249 domain-containing protein [Bacteroidota bacterium]